MRLTSEMSLTIRRWMAEDAQCVSLAAEIASLKLQRSAALSKFRRAETTLTAKSFRKLRATVTNFNLSFDQRRQAANDFCLAHRKASYALTSELNDILRRVDRRLEAGHLKLGRRRGHLNLHFHKSFVAVANREANRKARQKQTS